MRLTEPVIDTQRKRLANRTERISTATGLGAVGGMLFGGVFFAVGLAVVFIGLKIIPVDPSSVHAPYWILSVVGSVFALAGLMIWLMQVKAILASIRLKRTASLHPGESAFKDYAWNPRGMKKGPWKPVFQSLFGAFFMSVFLVPFNWWAWFSKEGVVPVKIIVSIFNLFLLLVFAELLRRIAAAIKYGSSSVEYIECPYRTGSSLVIRWFPPNGVPDTGCIQFTLRCVEEWMQTSGSGKNRSTHQIDEQLWAAGIKTEGRLSLRPGKPLDLSFDIPADAPPTRIQGAQKTVFWELEVNADVPGLDFNQRYLVPVYGQS